MDSTGFIKLPRPMLDDTTPDNNSERDAKTQHIERLLDSSRPGSSRDLLARGPNRFSGGKVGKVGKVGKMQKAKPDVIIEQKKTLTLDELAEIEMWKQARKKNFPSTSKEKTISHSKTSKQTKKLTLFEKLLN